MQVYPIERHLKRENKTVKKWVADYRTADGKRPRPEFDTKKLADEEIARQTLLKKKEKDRHTESLLNQDQPTRTLRELLDFHVTHVLAHWQPASVRDWVPRVMYFIEWCESLGITYAHQVTKKIALAYATHCITVAKRKSIELRIAAASAIFKSEIEFSEPPAIYRNPFQGVKKGGHYKKGKPKLVTQEHLNAFLECCPEFEYHLFRLEYGGGFRPGELQNLTWTQVKDKRIMLGDHDTWTAKTDESMGVIRFNDIMTESIAWFRLRTGAGRYVIDARIFSEHQARRPAITGRIGPNFMSRRFNRIKMVARERYPEYDWDNFTPHKLRVAYGSHLAEIGVPLPVVQQAMRHKSYTTTERHYVHISPGAIDEGVRQLDKVRLRKRPAEILDGDLDSQFPAVPKTG